ncbi:hypothetical protein FHR81_002112 [Actinoalloteichus hoggarensis]|uniref:Uncharacterized protein n=1 Tax=Actinoalloteichus hoggarensis TaxID=1470176 RepID=A0A221W5M7_9PSEU|nr:hypothetical protein [Actinoalloteichus hoggarensis]ASO21145.1 hypothetical protein AHOG_17600 [Actinoalloteichus hoggarensis]MBB5921074.1 hypothetical protein [Actinoalloteichus hoggarensis]
MSASDSAPDHATLLLTAGAILPDTDATGADRDVLTARRYTHPALDDRAVVRLVPDVLGRAEDLTCEYLGFDAPERTAKVGTARRSALGFPAWALVNDPANGHHALNLVKDVERLARTAKSRAGAAKDGFTALGTMLGRSAPHFLPTFYEEAARIFLQHGNTSYAATMFGKAREAEEVHDLEIDPERTREVFLEFAFAGALTAKALSAQAKALARRTDPDSAYTLFRTLCVERTRGGLPPYTGMPEDLRRLAKAARRDPAVEDEQLLRELLDTAAVGRAGIAFWKSYRAALAALARRDDAVRGRLLSFVPDATGALDVWLGILHDCGTTRLLVDPIETVPEGTRAPASWLSAVLAVRLGGWRAVSRSQVLLDLVAAMAPRLRADGEPVKAVRGRHDREVDLVDLLVSRDVPIAEAAGSPSGFAFDVSGWLSDDAPGRRDLTALAASDRFAPALGEGFVQHLRGHRRGQAADPEVLLRAMTVPGLRIALRRWIAARTAAVTTDGLPGLADGLAQLRVVRLPQAFVDVPEAAETLAALDVAGALRTTLRAGLLDELGWPALDEAVIRLYSAGGAQDEHVVVCGEGWPALVLRRGENFVVVGPDGVLAEHVARIPAESRPQRRIEPTAFWSDGVLLICWDGPEGGLAYWSDAPERIFATDTSLWRYRHQEISASIALPDGSRFRGGRALRPGDSAVPSADRVFGDGTTVWSTAYRRGGPRWIEVDPATGEQGRASLPGFLDDFAADGTSLVLHECVLRPAVPATSASPLGTADGLHGWRVRREADGALLGEGVDGRSVRMPSGGRVPTGLLRLPGGTRLVISEYGNGGLTLLDEGGVELGTLSTRARHPVYAAGTPLVAPTAWWHVLRPRDVAGSAALRGVSRQAVTELLAVASAEDPATVRTRQERLRAVARGTIPEQDGLVRAVRAALPDLTRPGLLAGVLGLVYHAAELLSEALAHVGIAESARAVDLEAAADTGPVVSQQDLASALGWFDDRHRHATAAGARRATLPALVAALGAVATETAPAGTALPEPHCDDWFEWLPSLAALAHRAASPLTPDEQRTALVLLLRSIADAGLADETGHWRVVRLAAPDKAPDPRHRVHPVGDGFLVLFERRHWYDGGDHYTGVQFARTPGRFAVPAGWTVSSSTEIRTTFGPERIARFLTVLADRGPAPWFPDAVADLVERTGLGSAEATVLLAGMPGIDGWAATYLGATDRRLLGLSSPGAKQARERFRPLLDRCRRRLLDAALPADPADLWTRGPDVAAVAEVWIAEHGRRVPVPDDVLLDASTRLPVRRASVFVTGVATPNTSWLTVDSDMRLDGTRLTARDSGGFDRSALLAIPQVLLWLAHRLPAVSPLRARLPESLAAARDRVRHPGFAVQLSGSVPAAELGALLGVDPPPAGTAAEHRGWLTLVSDHDKWARLIVRPGLVGPQDQALLAAVLERGYDQTLLAALKLLAEEGLTSACAAIAAEDTDPAAWFQDPTVSVPTLVAEVADRFGVDQDAATLYLQLLALPDPTDAHVARWTGWKPARLRRARAALTETDLVVSAKRARAGRSLFLPGGWLALKAPHLPLEAWKAPMFGFTTTPELVIAPRESAAELFARAWRRVCDGDAPAYEELKTGGRR